MADCHDAANKGDDGVQSISTASSLASDTTLQLPGRLGNPDMVLSEDPRLHPAVLINLKLDGKDGFAVPDSLPRDISYEDLLRASVDIDTAMIQMAEDTTRNWWENQPPIQGVETTTEIIKGVDGNDIVLYITKPTHFTGALPCVMHTHGGGMYLLAASFKPFIYYRSRLAMLGMIVVGVEFRNAGGLLGPHPFPAGLNDISSALQWCHDHKEELGYSKLILNGDSGGGNLALATVLKAKKDGKLDQVQGVFAQCPFIHGDRDTPDPTMHSWTENNGYEINVGMCWMATRLYDPEGEHRFNPLAYPYYASEEDLQGLPPMMIVANELDPLRDEGLAFFRKAANAGVRAMSITRNGTTHASEIQVWDVYPELGSWALLDIRNFTESL